MKVYKTVITYELECLTADKIGKDELDRIKHNIEINLNSYNKVTSGGKLVIAQKEITI